jgi:hypothetical protein
MKKVSLALSLAGALSGCHTWRSVNPYDIDRLAEARRGRVSASPTQHLHTELRAEVTNHYVDRTR